MKGLPGIFVAVALGVVGAVCNFFYVEKQARDYRTVDFVAVASAMNQGDRFQESKLKRVGVPANAIGDLDKSAVKWDSLASLLDKPATKNYDQGEIVLHQDTLTPAWRDLTDQVGEDEVVFWLPLDAGSFNPAQVNPGDLIKFRVPAFASPGNPAGTSAGGVATGGDEIIGPFRILRIGNRAGRREVHEAFRQSGGTGGAENLIAISSKVTNGKLEPMVQRILDIKQQTNMRGVTVLLMSSAAKK